jgi:SAM-dependent methyltransferase
MVNTTIRFYDENAKEFVENTINSNMNDHYAVFEKQFSKGARILDAGCGSGRDSKYFLEREYRVEAFDASKEMVRISSELTGIEVKQATFDDIEYEGFFDGIWACASLLHVTKSEMAATINRLSGMLRSNGVFYMSFKYGESEYIKGDRNFTCYTEDSFRKVLLQMPNLAEVKLYKTTDVREGRQDEFWLNVVLKKL